MWWVCREPIMDFNKFIGVSHTDDEAAVGAGSPCPPPIYRPRGDPPHIQVNFLNRIIGGNRHQPKLPNNVTLSEGSGSCPDCHPERSEGSGSRGSEILRCAQDDRAVLPAAPWPTRAHVRLSLMGIRADKSAIIP